MIGYYSSGTNTANNYTIGWDSTSSTSTSATIGNWVTTGAKLYIDTPAYDPNQRTAPPREFNKYISASDLLEEFIKWLGTQGVRQKQVMKLPMEYFVKWLIIRACEEDEEEPNVELPALPAAKTYHRCLGCGQFMPLAVALAIHAVCSARYFGKQLVEAT